MNQTVFSGIVKGLGLNATTHDKEYYQGIIKSDLKFVGLAGFLIDFVLVIAGYGAWVLQKSGWVTNYQTTTA